MYGRISQFQACCEGLGRSPSKPSTPPSPPDPQPLATTAVADKSVASRSQRRRRLAKTGIFVFIARYCGVDEGLGRKYNPKVALSGPSLEKEARMSKKAIWTIVIVVAVVFIGIWLAGISFVLRGLVKGPVSVKMGSVLVANLTGSIPEEAPGPISKLFGTKKKLTVQDAVGLFDAAKDDKRIDALLIKSGALEDVGWGKARELRSALLDFKASGKPVVAFLEAGSDRDYYLLSSADSIIMPELGMLLVDGLLFRVGFMKGTYGKLGINWQGVKKGKYKAATEPYTRESMSEPFREQLDGLLDDIYSEYLEAIAESRGRTPGQIASIIDEGPYLDAKAALEAGLIDRIAYLREIEEGLGIGESCSPEGKDKAIDWRDYASSRKKGIPFGRKKIAIVHAVGAITTGKSKDSPWSGKTMGSNTISNAISKAANNEQVKAIVMRVDSPGGSALASDIIWHEIQKAKEKKPFIVSMGDVAGSGGYYISCGADAIVAQPSTITASIGVLALIPDVSGLYKKIGFNIDTLKRGKHADFLATERPMTDWEKATLDGFIQVVYDRFVNLVAAGRGMTYDQVHEIAQGRVWTGVSAKEIGLIDDVGSLEKAIEIAKEKADIPEDEEVGFVHYPKKRTLGDLIMEGDFLDKIAWRVWERMPEELREALKMSRMKTLFKDEPVLLLVPEEIEIH